MNTRLLARWVEVFSWGFALLGLALPFVFHSSAFAAYRDALATWAYGSASLAASDRETLDLMLGILGGSITGKWIAHALLARGPLAEGRPWARMLSLTALALWFVVDSVASLSLGAGFNVWMINLVPLALIGVPLLAIRPSSSTGDLAPIDQTSTSTDELHRSGEPGSWSWIASLGSPRTCFWTSIFGITTGLVIAFGADTPMFSMWFAGLEDAHYQGVGLGESSRRLAVFFFGPIGGCTLAQFLMLAGFVRRESATLRVARAGTLSIAAWFLIDSAYGLAHGGLFNIALVNVPAAALTLPPWLAMASQLRGRLR